MRPIRPPHRVALTLTAVFAACSAAARQQPGNPPAAPTVNLPQTMTDASGNNWMIYQQGWLQMNGNNPIYGQSAQLTVNGNQPNTRNPNRCRVDEKTGELLFDFQPQQGLGVSRRVLMDRKAGYVRYVDIFKNTRQQEQSVTIQLATNLNFGVNAADIVTDPRKRENNMGVVATTDGPMCATEVYASRNAKLAPTLDWQPGNNTITATYVLPIAAGKSAAILHIHALSPTADAGVKQLETLKEAKVVADLPTDLRKQIVNFTSNNGMAGDYEVLRGDLFDVVELRGGDVYKGTIQEPSFKLQTFYGPVELPADRVVGIINVGDFKPRQLLVTSEGEIFGGHLSAETLHLQLSSGQVTQIPLSQVSRMGYRKRPGEPEEWTLSKPMTVLRTGERVQVELPNKPITVATRYGKLELVPQTVAALVLASEDHGVHEIVMADGSRFAGLIESPEFDMTLAGGKQVVKFPANSVARIQFAQPPEPADDAATMNLTNGDRLVGQLTGELKLDTSFDTIAVSAAEVKKLHHPDPTTLDVQVTLWDDSTVSGQLEAPDVAVKLNSGLTLTVPSALVGDYAQPLPSPSAATTARIKALVADLGSEDFAKREQSQADLVRMGPAVLKVLKELKGAQTPEGQQRIDAVVKQLEQKVSGKPSPGGRPNPGPVVDF